jgi:hypothetical protein
MQSSGIIGIVIFYIVLAKLSARMGEGLHLPPYYLWYYVSCIIALLAIPVHAYLHQKFTILHSLGVSIYSQGIYFSLLLAGNLIAILVSFRYWWWLKDEILSKRN